MSERWYDKTVEQTANLLETDIISGLKRDTVKKRRKHTGSNEIFPIPKDSLKEYLRHIMTDFTPILLLITVILATFFDKSTDLLIMIAILAFFYAVSVFAYVKSQQILERMGRYSLPNARVLRESKLYMIKQEQLVSGDIIYLGEGDIVPCDARLIESEKLEVLETNITSVAKTVRKRADFIEFRDIAPAQQENMLFASTIITKGKCKAIVCETGQDTLVCKMKKNIPVVSHDRIEAMESLKKFSSVWSLIMDGIIIILMVLNIILAKGNDSLYGIFATGLSLAVSSMSEFYVAFAYIILACGIFNAVRKFRSINSGALIKNTAKIDTIRDLTCLIVPKEGAFAVRNMHVESVWTGGELYGSEDKKYKKYASQVLKYALISTGLYGLARLQDKNLKNEDIYTPEEDILIRECEKLGIYNVGLEERYPMLQHVSAGGDSLFETTLTHFEKTNVAAVRGEYGPVLDRCRYYIEAGRVIELTSEKRNEIKIAAALLTKEALRVVAVATRDTVYNNLDNRLGACQNGMTFEGFIAIREPMLEGAAKNVSKCISSGMKIIMLTDDVSDHNKCLAESLGIISDESQAVTGSEIAQMKEGMFSANAKTYRLCQGLSNSQKRSLLTCLKRDGEKIGYLGRDLDDIVLLKEADVSYSQSLTIPSSKNGIDLTSDETVGVAGKTSGEALKFISDVVISAADQNGRGGFNAMIDSVTHAKVVYRNFLRMACYMISSQLARLIAVFYSVISGKEMLTPVQILFCGLVVDFSAVLIIAFKKPSMHLLKQNDDVLKKIKNPFISCPQSFLIGIFWGAAMIFMSILTVNYGLIAGEKTVISCVFISFVITQVVVLAESMRERSIFIPDIRLNIVNFMVILLLLVVIVCSLNYPGFGAAFNISSVGAKAWIGILSVPMVITLVYEVYKLLTGENFK